MFSIHFRLQYRFSVNKLPAALELHLQVPADCPQYHMMTVVVVVVVVVFLVAAVMAVVGVAAAAAAAVHMHLCT